MLIPKDDVIKMIKHNGIHIKGILHVGAHTCEELPTYREWGVDPSNMVWVDANDELTQNNKIRGISNCYTAALDNVERDAEFHVASNMQSSSLLEFGTHSASYPHITFTKTLSVRTMTLSMFFAKHNLNPKDYNVWNFDIQGNELNVFKGSEELLKYADVIYTEVNNGEVYKNNGVLSEIDEILNRNGLIRICTTMTDQNWGDALYVRKRSQSRYNIITHKMV